MYAPALSLLHLLYRYISIPIHIDPAMAFLSIKLRALALMWGSSNAPSSSYFAAMANRSRFVVISGGWRRPTAPKYFSL